MITGNEPVNACVAYDSLGGGFHQEGINLRQYYTGLAMQGLLANHAMIDTMNWDWIGENAPIIADKLIEGFNKNENLSSYDTSNNSSPV